MATLLERMVGAARLDAATYEEIEADAGAMGQAALVVVVSSLAAGVGAVRESGPAGLVVGTVVALFGWYVWALVTYLVGTRVLPGPRTEADLGQLLRTTGFSSSPGLVRVLGIVPGLGHLALAVAAVWMLVAMVVAVRQALDYETTGRAVLVCVVGFLCYLGCVFLLTFVLVSALGLTAAVTGR
jgi:hypothetical protein